jgi:hypothetical protein
VFNGRRRRSSSLVAVVGRLHCCIVRRPREAAEAAAREMDDFIREIFDLPTEGLTP